MPQLPLLDPARLLNRPRYLCWIDIETTGLSPTQDRILELAFKVTEFDYPYRAISAPSISGIPEEYLVDGSRDLRSWEVSERVLEMHRKSGLWACLIDDSVPKTTLFRVEENLLELSASWPISPEEKDQRVMIAGNSVGSFDLQFLRHHLPRFAARLSHRGFDASAFYRFTLSLGMPDLPKPEEAHRAMADLERSIELARKCARWCLEGRRALGEVEVVP